MEEKYVALIGLLLLKLGKYWTGEQSNIDEAYFIDDEWDAFFFSINCLQWQSNFKDISNLVLEIGYENIAETMRELKMLRNSFYDHL